jgi:hypothetical protein
MKRLTIRAAFALSRTAATMIATALLAAACGGGSSPSASGGSPAAGGSANSPSAVGYSSCIRSHGVPSFPDPTTDPRGHPFFDVSAQGVSRRAAHSPQFTAKISACQRLTGNFPFSLG